MLKNKWLLIPAVLLILLLLATLVISSYAEQLKAPLIREVRDISGIELAIRGDLKLSVLPRVSMVAEKISVVDGGGIIGNADAERVSITMSWLSLFRDPLTIANLRLDSAQIEIDPGVMEVVRRNKPVDPGTPREIPVVLEELQLDAVEISIGDALFGLDGIVSERSAGASSIDFRGSGADLKATLDLFGLQQVPAGEFEFTGTVKGNRPPFRLENLQARVGELRGRGNGSIDAERLTMDMTANGPNFREFVGSWVTLPLPALPFEANGRLEYGITNGELRFADTAGRVGAGIDVEFGGLVGVFLREPFDVSGLQLELAVAGPDLGELFPRLRLPDRPIAYAGELVVTRSNDSTVVKPIVGHLNDNHFTAQLTYTPDGAPIFDADIDTELLDLTDSFAPAQSQAESQAAEDTEQLTTGQLVPDLAMSLDFLLDKDFVIRMKSDKLLYAQYEARDLVASLVLDQRRLTLDVEKMMLGEGQLIMSTSLDERGPTPVVRLTANGEKLTFESPILVDGQPVVQPDSSIDIALDGSGTTLREVMTSLNGHARLEENASEGQWKLVRRFVEYINPLIPAQETTSMTCLLIDLEIDNGIVESDAIALETAEIELLAKGSLNLADESIDLRIRIGEHDGVTTARIFSPYVQIGGTLAEPAVNLEPGNTVVLLLTDGWSLLYYAFATMSRADENICEAAMRKAGKPDSVSPDTP